MISVIVADDHHLIRAGICALLERPADIHCVGQAADGREAVGLVKELAPDVLLMDIGMPRLNGIQATAQIRSLDAATRVVILSMHSEESLVREALRSGARGYLLKSSVAEELVLAIRAAHQGDIYLSPAVARSVTTDFLALHHRLQPSSPTGDLTPREREVLQLIAEGHTSRAIAHMLHISQKTVQKHRSSVMSKLGACNIATLIQTAISQRLVFLD